MIKNNLSLADHCRQFSDKRLLTIFAFGIASGFPWVMIGSAMSAWLKEAGLSRSSIGYFGAVFIAYSINFLWSPLVDRVKLPLFNALLGQRRSWILTTQLGIIIGCVTLSLIDTSQHLLLAGLAALFISISSSTQDIAIDAYRIDIIPISQQTKISAAAAMATSGWWTGYAGLGAIAFFLADLDSWTWSDIYLLLAGIMACLSLVVFLAKEPSTDREQQQLQYEQQYQQKFASSDFNKLPAALRKALIWLSVSLTAPIKEFFDRNGFKLAFSLLMFILLFKIGEAFLGRMSIVFYKEVGFSNSEIAIYSKLVSWWVTIFFSMVGSIFTMRFGIVKGLFIAGIAMAASNLMFALIAVTGPKELLFAAAVVIDGFTAAWGTVAFVSFISMLCNRSFTASQYALLASIGTLGRTFFGSASGKMVDMLGGHWVVFFVITALMVIPSLMILYSIKDRLHLIEQNQGGGGQ